MAYGKGIAKGMSLTLRQMFKPVATINYPEVRRDVPVYARTNLLWFEERCTGCSTCAQALYRSLPLRGDPARRPPR
jgi:NADH-quinone oxidoreductase subunit I